MSLRVGTRSSRPFHRVANIVTPLPGLLHPRVALRVLRASLQAARPAGSTEPVRAPALTDG